MDNRRDREGKATGVEKTTEREIPGTIDKLIDEYISAGLSGELTELVQGWLMEEGMGRKEKDRKIAAIWRQTVSFKDEPTDNAYRMYESASRRLGFPETELRRGVHRRGMVRRYALKAAAVLVPVLITAGLYLLAGRSEGFRESVFAAQGEPIRCQLADGSVCWLNAGSRIVNDGLRSVLLQGEAWFDITRDDKNSFVLRTDNISVRVHGTQFNVREREGCFTVTLYSGSLSVNCPGGEYLLRPGFELGFDDPTGGTQIDQIRTTMPEWMATPFGFEVAELREILSSYETIYGAKISYGSALAGGPTVTLKLRGNENLAEAMFLLSQVCGGFEYEIDGNTVTIK